MSPSAELLWQLNRNYVNRLARVRSYFDLVEPLLLDHSSRMPQSLLRVLQVTHARLTALSIDHRGWCYTYFYESPETKRMVQAPGAVRRALTTFVTMCDQNTPSLNELIGLFDGLPRPDPAMTRVVRSDLWDLMRTALQELVDFSNALHARDIA